MPTTPSLPEASQIEAPSMAAASIPRAPELIEHITLKQPIGELPLSGQNKIAAQRKRLDDYSEKRRKPLMQRLASVVWA
jgi:hypothetical protein